MSTKWVYRIHTECRDCGDTFIDDSRAPMLLRCRGCGRIGDDGKEQHIMPNTPEWNR